MKKKYFTYLLIAISSISLGQTLETTYTSSGYIERQPNYAFIANNQTNYYTLDWTKNEVKLYNNSHKLYKTTTLNLENGTEMRELYLASDKLFNSDSKIEFMLKSRQISSPYKSKFTVFNEDGDKIFTFTNGEEFKLIKTPDNNFKLLISEELANEQEILFKIYALSGTLSTDQENLLNKVGVIQFPNPASETINITNPLMNNENEKIQVYDINGRKVLEKNIIGNGKNIELDISKLSEGLYNYRIREFGNKFVKE